MPGRVGPVPIAPLLRQLLRNFVRQYCRRSPIEAGKVKLIGVTRRVEAHHLEEVSLPGGATITVDLADLLQRFLYFLGYYEYGVTKLVTSTLRPGDTFIDIGANIGYFTLVASPLVGPSGKVHSFEPIPGIFSTLQSNVAANGLTNVRMNQAAIFETDGELEL